MAKPVYMLCCEAQSVDKATGHVSHFNVFNSVHIAIGKEAIEKQAEEAPRPPMPFLSLTASSTWMREQGEEDAEFEYALTVRDANGSESPGPTGKFKFTRPFHRLDTSIYGLPFKSPGMAFVEMRIRKSGDTQWISQAYPMLVERVGDIASSAN